MIIDSSASIIRANIARLLVAYKIEPEDRIGLTLDLIECLARSMPARTDDDVFNLAVFVQFELDEFLRAHGSYPLTIENLANVAFAMRLGRPEFYRAICRDAACIGKHVKTKRNF